MMLEPERAASLVAERLARTPRSHAAGSLAATSAAAAGTGTCAELVPAGHAAHDAAGDSPLLQRDWLVRRTLEELGIHCEANASLHDLKGFLIASPRGAEIVVSEHLGEEERLALYAHLLAHALLEGGSRADAIEGAFFSRLEYVEGREPADVAGSDRKAEMVADALARAILRGSLDGAPKYVYRHTRERALRDGLRPRLGQLVLEICHRTSQALFWHSPKYQRLRGRPEMSALVRRLEGLVKVAYAC